jgi:hypothetical protein
MSTGLYLKCLSHKVPIRSDELKRKDADGLAKIREMVTNRDSLVAAFEIAKEYISLDSFNSDTWVMSFLIEHPMCEIGLFDGYDHRYRIDTDSYQADWGEPTKDSARSEKLIHMATFLDGYAVPRCLQTMTLRRDDMSHQVTCPDCIIEAKRLGLYRS